MYRKGFALLLFGIMMAPLAHSELQWLTVAGMILGTIGLVMVLIDSGDTGKNAPDDDEEE